MNKRYHRLASIFVLAALPLMAESMPNEGEEIALESQETAQFGNRKSNTLSLKDTRKRCRECRDEPDVLVVPEEIAIENQKGVITPSVYPYVSHGPNIAASVAFIWWQTTLNGTYYAYNGTSDGSLFAPVGVSVAKGQTERVAFGYEPGFKLALGKTFEHDGWDLKLEYTYLPASSSDNSVEGEPGSGAQTAVNVTTGDGIVAPITLVSADAKWNQSYNVLDLALGRNFFISKFLTLRPFVGVKSAWITEKFTYLFFPTPNITDPRDGLFNQVLQYKQFNKQSLFGIGLRGGIDTMWHMNKNFAFYGDLALSTIWSRIHVKQFDTTTESIEGTYNTVREDFIVTTMLPVIETELGLAYIMWFSEDRFRLQMQLGWENQIWTDFNYFQMDGSGSLTTQGLTLKVGLTF